MNVLAIGAHPDDIEYGCGGMLTKYAQRGHDVYLWVASDGSLALSAAQERCPDLVLADVMMPNMDGFELTRRLRQDPRPQQHEERRRRQAADDHRGGRVAECATRIHALARHATEAASIRANQARITSR